MTGNSRDDGYIYAENFEIFFVLASYSCECNLEINIKHVQSGTPTPPPPPKKKVSKTPWFVEHLIN